VFLRLHGKRAVIAGDGPAAAWKAELLRAAGATVTPYVDDLDLAGAAIALIDAADDDDAARFQAACRAAGVPCCAIDRPRFSDLQFGSIVNRSPVVIGITTDGGAPILAQAIRRRIETLLPRFLGAWGRLAQALRPTVARRHADPGERRRFWENFAERSFAAPPPDNLAMLLDESAMPMHDQCKGGVTLVGAGPGDAELLTLKAVRALQGADVILYDDLVSDDVLELARREAKRMLVGKRGGRPSCRQDEINALMVRLALQGKRVVRLKSGDPMIFGRGGEEIAELQVRGIPVQVVPGITAGLAMASALGVSLTHRDVAQSVRFVTGHARDGGLPPDLDWRGLADPRTTLVVYMARGTASAFASRLIAHGAAADMPLVAVTAISRPEEARWTGTLAELARNGAALPDDGAPLLIAIGRVLKHVGCVRADLSTEGRTVAA
jgi:uroporphyrin-III C-methyltransferase/precorrin-2 dehydrogenase/sirohydrochlorin ferrochelatase